MSHTRVALWSCDRCGAHRYIHGPAEVLDDHMPEGWIHTMMGDDLCTECQR